MIAAMVKVMVCLKGIKKCLCALLCGRGVVTSAMDDFLKDT